MDASLDWPTVASPKLIVLEERSRSGAWGAGVSVSSVPVGAEVGSDVPGGCVSTGGLSWEELSSSSWGVSEQPGATRAAVRNRPGNQRPVGKKGCLMRKPPRQLASWMGPVPGVTTNQSFVYHVSRIPGSTVEA